MAAKRVVCIGFFMPDAGFEEVGYNAKISLLDYDIVVIDPNIGDYQNYIDRHYLGKPTLDDTGSFRLKEQAEHWRREILEFLRAGKNVFLMLNTNDEIFVATGEKSYSGTGSNRVTTTHVDSFSNYQIIPSGLTTVNSNGSSMALQGKDNVLASYWASVGEASEYRVLVSGDNVPAVIVTKAGNKTVGARLKYKNAEGNLFLLPYIDFSREEFSYLDKEEDEYCWTESAVALGKKFAAAIVSLDKVVRQANDLSAQPDWLDQRKFVLPKEEKVRSKLVVVVDKLEQIQMNKERLEQNLAEESVLKRLLYEKGRPLEEVVRFALDLMGFKVSHYEDSESEFDVVFESKEGRLIGEVEGRDNKAINIEKLRQLEMNIHEDFSRDDVDEIAHGALFGNAYRLLTPEKRNEFFTKKCVTAANRSGTALVSTVDLFEAAKYLSGKSNKTFAKQCRKAIIDTTGKVTFPEIPKAINEKKIVADD